MRKKVYYPQSIVAATSNRKLTSSAFRAGFLTLDTSKSDTRHYKYNGLSNEYVQLNYIFDTVAHLDYAKLQDAEDWKESSTFGPTVPLKALFVEIFDRLQSDIEHAAGGNDEIVYADIYVDIYGVGNRHVTVQFRIYANQESRGEPLWFNVDHTLDTNRSFNINVDSSAISFLYTRKSIQPDSYYIKRKFCPYVVQYLSEGLSLL